MEIGGDGFINFTRKSRGYSYFRDAAAEKAEENRVIEDAKRYIASRITDRTYVIQKKEKSNELVWTKIGDFLSECGDEQETAKADRYYEKLLKELMAFADTSKEHALMLKKLMFYSSFSFAVTLDPEITFDKSISKYTAMYIPYEKTIVVPCTTFDGKINEGLFREILAHEGAHALDDLSCYETEDNGSNLVSQKILKQRIKPLLDAEMKNNKNLRRKLMELRKRKIAESPENKNLSESEIARLLDESFKKRPLYIIDKKSKEETELVKNATWCWFEPDNDNIIVPFIGIMAYFDYLKITKTPLGGGVDKEDFLSSEYAAYGIQIILSGRSGILKEKDKNFYALIKNTIMPRIMI